MNPYLLIAFQDELEKIAISSPVALGVKRGIGIGAISGGLSSDDPIRGVPAGAIGGATGGLAGSALGAGAAFLPALIVGKRDPLLAMALLEAGVAAGATAGAISGGHRAGRAVNERRDEIQDFLKKTRRG